MVATHSEFHVTQFLFPSLNKSLSEFICWKICNDTDKNKRINGQVAQSLFSSILKKNTWVLNTRKVGKKR